MSSGPPNSYPPPSGPLGQRSRPAPPRGLRTTRLLLGLLVVAIVGPCAYQETPREVARWHVAAAEEAREAGRTDAAWESLGRALAWDPENPVWHLKRAQWHKADRDFVAALDDVNRADELRPDNASVLILRAEILQHLGRHDEAIATWKALDRQSLASGRPPREQALNGLAYARAVGNAELDAGLEAINRALELAPGNAALLDTRGFLLYRQGKYAEALRDIDPAVKEFENARRSAEAEPSLLERVATYNVLSEPPRDLAKQGAAVLHYHRALVLEKLGRFAEAKLDRARAKRLIGREPDETLF